jgi:hypothetical protein
MGDEGIICSPANAKTPLNCHLEAPADATRICFCKGEDDVYKLAPKGANSGSEDGLKTG